MSLDISDISTKRNGMSHLIKCVSVVCAAVSSVLASGCAVTPIDDGAEGAVVQASHGSTEIHPEDDCDPTTFGALCNPNFHGMTSLSAFIAELTARGVIVSAGHSNATFAQATGGRAFYNTNDLKGAFQKAANDNSSYYVLSYYLERKDKKPGWHKLSVKVDRHGSEVRARNGFFLQQESTQQLAKTALEIALKSPLEYTGIPITGRWQQVTPAAEPGKKKVVFILTMPPNFAEVDETNNNHIELEIVAVARTATGESAGDALKTMDGHLKPDSLKQIRESGLDYRGALTLAPGEYTVHFAVQDQLSGRMGSVNTPLKVEP